MQPSIEIVRDVRREARDGELHLLAPDGIVKLKSLGKYFTDYEFACEFSAQYHWEMVCWKMRFSEDLVDDFTPDSCEVELTDRHIWVVYNPKRHLQRVGGKGHRGKKSGAAHANLNIDPFSSSWRPWCQLAMRIHPGICSDPGA